MFLFEFPTSRMEEFQDGSFPKVYRISHSFENPTWHFALHVHMDLIELIYVAGGCAEIVIDKQTYHVEKGDILLVDQELPHSITSDPNHPSDIWTLMVSDVKFREQSPGKLVTARTQAGEDSLFIEQTMHQIQYFSQHLDQSAQSVCNCLCAALTIMFHQLLVKASAAFEVKPPSLAFNVFTYLDSNYGQPINLEQLSKVFLASASHISREFRAMYHISPINYLIDKRLSEAKWLLITTDAPIPKIAEQVGYENVYYFGKLFKSRTGYTPTDYRERFRNAAKGMA